MTNDPEPRDAPEPEQPPDGDGLGDDLGQSVVVYQRPEQGLSATEDEERMLRLVWRWGKLMHASGFFPDTKSQAQAAVKILAGRELGFATVESITGVHIIDGKPTIGAGLLANALKRSGRYDYRVAEHTNERCTLELYRIDPRGRREHIGTETFTMADAENAMLLGRGSHMWEKYPRNMLFARCISNAIAFHAPDALATRVYTPEEIRPDLEVNAFGEVADYTAIQAAPRPLGPDDEDSPFSDAAEAPPPRPAAQPVERAPARPAPPSGPRITTRHDLIRLGTGTFGIDAPTLLAAAAEVLGRPVARASEIPEEPEVLASVWARLAGQYEPRERRATRNAHADEPLTRETVKVTSDVFRYAQQHGRDQDWTLAALACETVSDVPKHYGGVAGIHHAVDRIDEMIRREGEGGGEEVGDGGGAQAEPPGVVGTGAPDDPYLEPEAAPPPEDE